MPRGKMTDAHKKAIKEGRKESAAIKAYLDQISGRPRRAADPKAISRRLAAVDARIGGERNSLKLVDLHQQRENLQSALASAESTTQGPDLEKAFVSVAKSYSERKGIGYKAWRAVGVPADVLKKAGISRGEQ